MLSGPLRKPVLWCRFEMMTKVVATAMEGNGLGQEKLRGEIRRTGSWIQWEEEKAKDDLQGSGLGALLDGGAAPWEMVGSLLVWGVWRRSRGDAQQWVWYLALVFRREIEWFEWGMGENTKWGYVVEENDRNEDISGQSQHWRDTIFGSCSRQTAGLWICTLRRRSLWTVAWCYLSCEWRMYCNQNEKSTKEKKKPIS